MRGIVEGMGASTKNLPRHRRRSGLGMLLILVACCAIYLRTWKDLRESGPTVASPDAIRYGSTALRIAAMEEIWMYPAERSRGAVPALIDSLKDPVATIRARAAGAIGQLFTTSDEAIAPMIPIDCLLKAAGDTEPEVRTAAVKAFGAIYRDVTATAQKGQGKRAIVPPEVRDALVRSVDDLAFEVRREAIVSLCYVYQQSSTNPPNLNLYFTLAHYQGAPSCPIAPPPDVSASILRAAEHPGAETRIDAMDAMAMGLVGPKVALAAFARSASDADAAVRARVLRYVALLARSSPAACLIAVRALRDPSQEVRREARIDFQAPPGAPIGAPIPAEAVPDLIEILEDPDRHKVAGVALLYLEWIGPAAKAAIPVVARRADPGKLVRDTSRAERTLGAIGPGSPEAKAAIPRLIARLKAQEGQDIQKSVRSRMQAAYTLATYVWEPSVVAALRESATRDPSEIVRYQAAISLGNLRWPDPVDEP